ncbi:hypothetical protein ACHQM5_011613 [Ranunculus cassubicifolius]
MDAHGDHALQCAKDVGPKFRHNVVRDTVADMTGRVGIQVRKEVPVGLINDKGIELKPADVMFFGWGGGKDLCVDLIGVSPFAGDGLNRFQAGNAVIAAERRKISKYQEACTKGGFGFAPFSFSTFGELGPGALDIMDRICRHTSAHFGTKSTTYLYQRLGFSVQKGVGAQLMARLPTNYM